MIGNEKVDRLPIIVSSNSVEKLLCVPKLDSGTGEQMAKAVVKALEEWKLADLVEGMSFDTTSSNTGNIKGACRFLEKFLGRELAYFACRHHVFEIVLRQVFEVKFGKTTGPDVPIFEALKKHWNSLDLQNFKSGIEDVVVCRRIKSDERENVLQFCLKKLSKSHCRADYKEFLELTVLFLGEKPSNFKNLHRPGSTCHARWMAKAINALKLFLLRDQITFKSKERTQLRDMCVFIIKMYVPAWFSCTNSIEAANNDLKFIKQGIDYSKIDQSVSKAIINKMSKHLWYLSEELIGLAFYDPNVSINEKKKMVENLRCQQSNHMNRIIVHATPADVGKYSNKNLSDFVTTETSRFFDRFCLSTEFMEFDPSSWETREDYLQGRSFCQGLNVVNDSAERGVKLMSDFNQILVKKEEEKQYLLQVVEQYRRKYPSSAKSVLLKE